LTRLHYRIHTRMLPILRVESLGTSWCTTFFSERTFLRFIFVSNLSMLLAQPKPRFHAKTEPAIMISDDCEKGHKMYLKNDIIFRHEGEFDVPLHYLCLAYSIPGRTNTQGLKITE
jgi:hypothetical protein